MSILSSLLASVKLTKLGSCSRCTRQAFRFSALSWVLTLFCAYYSPSLVFQSIFALSVCLTLLWIAHLVAYSTRAISAKVAGNANIDGKTRMVISSSRRDFLPLFARVLAGAALASAITSPAFADSACGGFNGECKPCARRNSANTDCEWCHSCGSNCPQNNNC